MECKRRRRGKEKRRLIKAIMVRQYRPDLICLLETKVQDMITEIVNSIRVANGANGVAGVIMIVIRIEGIIY